MKTVKYTSNGIEKSNISDRANEILNNVYSKNTSEAYVNDITKYLNYCDSNNLDRVIQSSLMQYLTFLSNTCKFSTLQRKSVSIQSIVTIKDKKILSNFLKGLRRTCLNEGKRTIGAKAATKEIITDMINSIDTTSLTGLRNKALILVGFYGAFRVSELINLKVENITIDTDGMTIFIERGKTDQEAKGSYKFIPYKNAKLCAVTSLKEYMNKANITTGYIFRQIKKGDKVQNEPISRQAAHNIVKEYNEVFTIHSLRAGFITSASEAGATIQQIQSQSGHKTAQMILHYTRSTDVKKNNAVNLL